MRGETGAGGSRLTSKITILAISELNMELGTFYVSHVSIVKRWKEEIQGNRLRWIWRKNSVSLQYHIYIYICVSWVCMRWPFMSPINRVNLPFLYDDSWSPFWGSPKFLQRRIVSWPICTSCLRHSSGQWSLPSCGLVIFTDPITSSYPPSSLPSGKLTWLWKITIFIGKTHYKWPFSIAMLNYQRVSRPSFLFF